MHRRLLWSLAACSALWLVAPAHAAGSGAAPADAYFGALKMTPLQIRVKVDLLGRAYHARWSSDHDILHDATFAEAALRAWRNAYPNDPWLAPTAYHLEQLYQALQLPEARKHAVAMLHYVVMYWPKTSYGRTSRLRLARGFPALHGESPVRPTPNPYARSSAPRPLPTLAPTAAASPALQPTTTPAPQPSVGKTPL